MKLLIFTLALALSQVSCIFGDSPGDRVDCGSIQGVESTRYNVRIDSSLPHQEIMDALQEWSDRTCGLVSFEETPGPLYEVGQIPTGTYQIVSDNMAGGHAGLTWNTGDDGLRPGAAYTQIKSSQSRDSNFQRIALHEAGHVLVGRGFGGQDPWHYVGDQESALGSDGDITLHLHDVELRAFCRMHGGTCTTRSVE